MVQAEEIKGSGMFGFRINQMKLDEYVLLP